MTPILRVNNLHVRFNSLPVLQDVSFDVNAGDILAIMGPNGSGKSTLFRAILDLVPYEGEIERQAGLKIGYVPQRLDIDRDLPLSVEEFLSFKNVPRQEIFEALEAVGFHHHHFNSRVGNLSGGELQRLLIAYAIIGHPDVLLFDEPTAGIDIGGEETIYSLLEKLHRKNNLTILLISHDLNIVFKHAHRVLCLNVRKVCYGTPKEALTPKALEQLYGTAVGFYHHQGHDH